MRCIHQHPGGRASGSLVSANEGYSCDQEPDVECAVEWSLGDESNTRSGISRWSGEGSGAEWASECAVAGKGSKRKCSGLNGVTRRVCEVRRREVQSLKPRIWKAVARRHPDRYTEAQLVKMRAGQPPVGGDGESMVIHHLRPLKDGGRSNWTNGAFIEASVHRKCNKQLQHPWPPIESMKWQSNSGTSY